jgi:hypothetical protein
MRGGVGDADVWFDIVSSSVKESRLSDLAKALETQFANETPKNDGEYNRIVMNVFSQYIQATDAETNKILSTTTDESLIELLGVQRPVVAPPVAVAPQLVVDTGRAAPMSEEDGAPPSASGTASPISRGTASSSRTPVGTPVAPGTPVIMLSPDAKGGPVSRAQQSPPATEGRPAPVSSSLATVPIGDALELDGDVAIGKGRVFALGKRPDWL